MDLSALPTPSCQHDGDVPSLRMIAEHLLALPSLPAVANAILEMVLNEEYERSDLSRLLETDPALSLKILNHANSAIFAAKGQVARIDQALNRLGSKTIQALMLSVLIKDSLITGDQADSAMHMALWKHSLAAAVFSMLIAQQVAPELAGTVFGAGILHDIGRIFMFMHGGEHYLSAVERMEELGEPVLTAEMAVFKTDHTRIGSKIASNWKLPRLFADVIAFHHHDAPVLQNLQTHPVPVAIVALGNLLAHGTLMDEAANVLADEGRIRDLCTMLGLSAEVLQTIRTDFAPAYAERARPFNLEDDQVGLFLTSLQKANQRLLRMSLDLEKANSHLADSNLFAALGAQFGQRLSHARYSEEVFDCVPRCFKGGELVRGGFVYWSVPDEGLLQGLIWNSSGSTRGVTYRLDDSGKPDLASGIDLPENLRAILEGHHSRYEGNSRMDRELRLQQFFVHRDYFLFPLVGGDFSGELCILRSKQRPPKMTPQEYMGYSQVCCVVSATLERVRLFESLQERADELSMALRKNQQINLQLRQTERLASVGQLAAGAAHEINNPLAIISARTQLLERREKDEKNRRDLQQISEQIGRISTILKSLMGFARPNPPQISSVDLNVLLEKIIALVESIFASHRISIVRHLALDLPVVSADSNQLEQVFLNLVINAQHAMEGEAGGVMTVTTRLLGDSKCVSVSIRDTGCGIAAENLSRIFDPFFSTKSEGKGTGLGLSTAYGIVTGHYGTINVTSTVGMGTEMTVVLPVNAAHGRKHPLTTMPR